jgi:transposase-like protein
MWNSEKRTYTCPKCGKTRSLRSNSRENLCPECDLYSASKPAPKFDEGREGIGGIGRVTTLWSDGNGLTLRYVDNGSHIASLYEYNKYIGEVNIDLFCRKYRLVFELGPQLQSESFQIVMRSAVDKILFTDEVVANRTEKIGALRGLDPVQAEVVNLYESGMMPVSIALKTGVSFSEVMDMISEIPPMRIEDRDTDRQRPRAPEKNWYLTGEFERA